MFTYVGMGVDVCACTCVRNMQPSLFKYFTIKYMYIYKLYVLTCVHVCASTNRHR